MSIIQKSDIPKSYIPSHLTVGSKVVLRINNIDNYNSKKIYTIDSIEYIENAPIAMRLYERTEDIYLYTLKDENGNIIEKQYTQSFLDKDVKYFNVSF